MAASPIDPVSRPCRLAIPSSSEAYRCDAFTPREAAIEPERDARIARAAGGSQVDSAREVIQIRGAVPLSGRIRNDSAKNAALPLMAATILCDGEVSLEGIPDCGDARDMAAVLDGLGLRRKQEGSTVTASAAGLRWRALVGPSAERIRHSFLVAGPLLARFGKAVLPAPGGCNIGSRPVDLHLAGFEALGARWRIDAEGLYHIEAERLEGAHIALRTPSVGATMNLVMAATGAHGETTIENAAREPEVVHLVALLRAMGARVSGEGSARITVDGRDALHGAACRVMPDRINAFTYLAIGALVGEDLEVEHFPREHLAAPLSALRTMGADFSTHGDVVRVTARGLVASEVTTGPYPGVPTDLQPIFSALLATARGRSRVTETVFDGRLSHARDLAKMGARISVAGRTLEIDGGPLSGAHVAAADIRSGAALVVAACHARGLTTISGFEHVQRGYADMPGKLASVGADVRSVARPPA